MFHSDHFEADVTDFVKNLSREMIASKNLIWGSEHRLSMQAQAEHEQAQAEHERAQASTSKF